MNLSVSLGAYLISATALVSGTTAGLTTLTDGPARSARASESLRPPKAIAKPEVSHAAFRYGPDVNHGRSDTPVYAAAQARAQAKAGPVRVQKNVTVRPWRDREPGALGIAPMAPSVPSTGH